MAPDERGVPPVRAVLHCHDDAGCRFPVTRAQLEHNIRAAATISSDPDIVVIGSQAILGQFPDAPAELLVSNEADVYPKGHPERSDLIDGSIGELSPFHETYRESGGRPP